jgi:hypothetical protein
LLYPHLKHFFNSEFSLLVRSAVRNPAQAGSAYVNQSSMFKLALRTLCFPSFFTGLQPKDFVKKWPYLGRIISQDCDDFDDLCAKKISLIGQVNEI